jgi:hypothetical protein
MSKWSIAVLTAASLMFGCASEVKRNPAELAQAGLEQGQRQITAKTASFVLDSGYERTINLNTEFVVVGRISQGLVLRPTQTVLTVEGAHMHEAYAVLNNGQLVGFYLPVERAFSALPLAVPFSLTERK